MKLSRAGAFLAVAIALAPAISRADTAGLTFNHVNVARVTIPDSQIRIGALITYVTIPMPQPFARITPQLAIGPGTSPALYYAIDDVATLWRSANAGASWVAKPTPAKDDAAVIGGATDLAVDAGGTLYLSREYGKHPVPAWSSANGGDTWANGKYVGQTRVCPHERQFTAAGSAGKVIHARQCGASANGIPNYAIYGWTSSDGGATYTPPHSIIVDRSVVVTGPPAFAGSAIYIAYATSADELRVAKSSDGGATWTSGKVADVDAHRLAYHPVVAADDAGNVFVAWSVPGLDAYVAQPAEQVFLSTSTDGGAAWTAPLVASDPARSAVYPSIVAGAAGKVAVAYYTVADAVDPAVEGVSSWNLEVAQSLNATAASPAFTRDVVATAVHFGGLRTDPHGDVLRPTPWDSRIGQPEARIDASGALYVAYPKLVAPLAPLTVADDAVDLLLVVQTGGPTLRP